MFILLARIVRTAVQHNNILTCHALTDHLNSIDKGTHCGFMEMVAFIAVAGDLLLQAHRTFMVHG